MGQAANSNRRASLDDQKQRAAGRSGEHEKVKDAVKPRDERGMAGGAFGTDGRANRKAGQNSQGEGSGGGGAAPGRDEVTREAGRSTRPARKQK